MGFYSFRSILGEEGIGVGTVCGFYSRDLGWVFFLGFSLVYFSCSVRLFRLEFRSEGERGGEEVLFVFFSGEFFFSR